MTLQEWAGRLVEGKIESISVTAHLDPMSDTFTPLEILFKTDPPLDEGSLVLGEDGESLMLENRASPEADLGEAGRIVSTDQIPGISAAILGKPIQEVTLFECGGVTIGLKLTVNDGSELNVFNNGDKFMISEAPYLWPPGEEKLGMTTFRSDNPVS